MTVTERSLDEFTYGPSNKKGVHERTRVSTEKEMKMVAGSFYIPKRNELKPRGEDAHFICAKTQTIGVADGIGSWSKKGVDAGDYARTLMHNSAIAIQNQPDGEIDPKKVLNEAFSNTEAEGSSTACILTLNADKLDVANIGDSGFVLIRGGKIVYKSAVQQRKFNCPYQLGKTRDCPRLAMEIRVGVESGDIIVAGTDGLFDNIFESEIELLVNLGLEKCEKPEILACSIAQFASVKSVDKWVCSPFEIAARKAGFEYMGGKYDDITVIVGYIVRNSNEMRQPYPKLVPFGICCTSIFVIYIFLRLKKKI